MPLTSSPFSLVFRIGWRLIGFPGVAAGDYSERMADAKVRTIIDSTDGDQSWSTVGVSTNMIEASWKALVDGVLYGLARGEIGQNGRRETTENG